MGDLLPKSTFEFYLLAFAWSDRLTAENKFHPVGDKENKRLLDVHRWTDGNQIDELRGLAYQAG